MKTSNPLRIFTKEKRQIHMNLTLWRRHPDLNRGIKVLQTSALPLGDTPSLTIKLIGVDSGIRTHA